MNRAVLYNSLPGDLKKAIRAYEPLEAKTKDELHDILVTLREKFDLSPWHPLTLFIKKFALGRRSGRPFKATNVWVSLSNKDNEYTSASIEWANVLIHVHLKSGTRDLHAAIWPAKEKLWSYQTEHCVSNLIVMKHDTEKRAPLVLSRGWLMDQAYAIIKNTGNNHKLVELDYHVGSSDTRQYIYVKGKKRSRKEKETITLNDVLTPDPKALNATKPASVVMPLDAPTPITPIKAGVLEPGDSEVLLTMLEMASLKLKELGMYSTLNRWRATIRRLTKHEITENQTESPGSSNNVPGDA